MTIYYPALLPPPNQSKYELQPTDPVIRTQMDSGSPRNRRRFTQYPTQIPVEWTFTTTEFRLFEAWFVQTINAGVSWFDVGIANGMGITSCSARFVGLGKNAYKAAMQPGLKWVVSSVLEVSVLPQMAATDLALQLAAPTLPYNSGALDAFLSSINNIGIPGTQGFGVGICPTLPTGFTLLSGTADKISANYGNYQYSDGSIMVWVPAFYYKIGTGSNGFPLNFCDVKNYSAFISIASANAAGYALHRAFYDGGLVKQGFFVDKYLCSNNRGVASSLPLGLPLSADGSHNPFSGLTGAPLNLINSAIVAAKTRGGQFFCSSRFIFSALAMLSMAHGIAATSSEFCGWYDVSGIKNYPKGNNNNALGDIDDSTIAFQTDGYIHTNCSMSGSANYLAKTTHNGQLNGICDLNGNFHEITPGITTDDANTGIYALKLSVAMASVTSGNTLPTDLWGALGLSAIYDALGSPVGALSVGTSLFMGSSLAQVLSDSVTGVLWVATCSGIPIASGGSNLFGNDRLFMYAGGACILSGGSFDQGSYAGVWAADLSFPYNFGMGVNDASFRSALYLP